MAQNTFNLSPEQLALVQEALENLFPIPTHDVGTEEEPDIQPIYASDLHPEMCVKNWLETQVKRWAQVKAKREAENIDFSIDLTQ